MKKQIADFEHEKQQEIANFEKYKQEEIKKLKYEKIKKMNGGLYGFNSFLHTRNIIYLQYL